MTDMTRLFPSLCRTPRRLVLGVAAGLPLAACSVGPDYKGPPHVAPVAEHARAFNRADPTRTPAQEPLAQWWTGLNDPLLNTLITTALQNSPDVKQAAARLHTARATQRERFAGFFPGGGAAAFWDRTRIPTGDITSVLGGSGAEQAMTLPPAIKSDSYGAGFDASWEIDPFGGNRRGYEGARAQSEAQLAQLADTRLRLVADVARNYVSLRDVQNRLALMERTITIERQMLDLTRQRRAQGTVSQEDVARFAGQLAQVEGAIAPMKAQQASYMDALATLVGREPGQLDAMLARPAPVPVPPAVVPVGNPADMIRRRPDIRVAERDIAANNAQIGQAIGQYFPKVSLFGTVGFTGANGQRFFSGDSFSYMGGPTLEWSILNFARTNSRVGQAKGGRDAALAHYQNVVLAALQDAEGSLSRFGHQREYVLKLDEARAASDQSWTLAQQRQRAGTLSVIDALDVERQRIQIEQQQAQARASMTTDYIAVQKALGLGWQSAPAPQPTTGPKPAH
ncbi:efflux transporter outer membrane subunit [Komagataeibacter sp. AV436]|uniref:Efflux transporter outer membrane subunit n=2 Tax=Komagataeibacter melomenusus TaxID=2766578 RepID=A0ABX2ABF5_9PROT|nr:efflux transporter outer membrane subunit [Komagataeibacter melomenusus]NPC65151.1 efflux transporter outer membrane subunit [Komagataeibacter melomenusus]